MLRLNGRPSGTRVVGLASAGETKVTFEPVALPAGLVHGEVTIDPDSLAADDTARFALTSDDALRVLLVAPDDAERDETLFIERALAVGTAPAVKIERLRPDGLRVATERVTITPRWHAIDTIEWHDRGWVLSADQLTFLLPRASFVDEAADKAHQQNPASAPIIAAMIDIIDGGYEREMLYDVTPE